MLIIINESGNSCERYDSRTAGARVARSTPDRKVICSNQVWFIDFLHFFAIFAI